MDIKTLHVRKLSLEDLPQLQAMDTGIEDDYVIYIFENLVTEKSHSVYGLFDHEKMVAIAGYTVFAKHFAVLGRLRSDRRYRGNGHATELLKWIMDELNGMDDIHWIGAATNEPNLPARRVLDKLGLSADAIYHSLVLKSPDVFGSVADGPVWDPVTDISEKRKILLAHQNNALGMFPYECYYPLPFVEELFADEYLDSLAIFINPDGDRFVALKADSKGDWYAHVKYFWDDHFEQPGFWKTVFEYTRQHRNSMGIWIDFSPQGFRNIPNLEAFDIQEPWMMYGVWKKR
ncbi:GNAT family N-acetyltransferase [Bacillaceae bacterium S4-13-58]